MRKSYFYALVLCTMFVFNPSTFAADSDKIPIKRDKATNTSYITSLTDPGWSYTCKDGIEVDLVSSGLKNNVPMTLPIDDVQHSPVPSRRRSSSSSISKSAHIPRSRSRRRSSASSASSPAKQQLLAREVLNILGIDSIGIDSIDLDDDYD